MKLEGVICCVDYADLLAETLPLNLRHFDPGDLLVVTAPEDKETQRICRYYGVRHCQTDAFRSRWGEFAKAKGINVGLGNLRLDGWVLHLDADIVLPPSTRTLLERKNLDPLWLYGVDRLIVEGHDAWRTHQAMPPLQQDNYRVHLDVFRLAPRFSGERMGGYAPPGYFQLWHSGWSNVDSYPEEHSSAAKTDVMFASRWLPARRALLPEFCVYHLEPEPTAQGANWGGRVTSRWGPEPDRNDVNHPANHRPPPTMPGPSAMPGATKTTGYGQSPSNVRRPRVIVPGFRPHVGHRLRADPGQWDGSSPIEFSYQWMRGNTGPIAGATSQSYRPTHHDLGFRLMVSVRGNNDFGGATMISRATAKVVQ